MLSRIRDDWLIGEASDELRLLWVDLSWGVAVLRLGVVNKEPSLKFFVLRVRRAISGFGLFSSHSRELTLLGLIDVNAT